ncbi:non-contractile tail fiber protein [Shigella phage ESh3]|nr:non-contractile tail fiber protein [Shigella phage ESh3]
MANVIKTVLTYPLDGSNRDFNIPFEYLARKFVVVTLIGVDRKVLTINTDYRFATRTTISLTKAWGPADGYTLIELRRVTSTTDRLVDFTDGSILRAYDLNVAQIQTMHVAEEARDLTADTIGVNNDGHLDARGRRIVNVADGIEPGDAITLGQVTRWNDSALNSKNAAKVSETNAKDSENKAKASETNAKNSENLAHDWAQKSEDSPVTGSEYSAYHYSRKSSASANAAASSAAASLSSQNAAKVSEDNAKVSETNAKASEVSAKDDADRAEREADKLGNMNALAEAIETVQDGYVLWKNHVRTKSGNVFAERWFDVEPAFNEYYASSLLIATYRISGIERLTTALYTEGNWGQGATERGTIAILRRNGGNELTGGAYFHFYPNGSFYSNTHSAMGWQGGWEDVAREPHRAPFRVNDVVNNNGGFVPALTCYSVSTGGYPLRFTTGIISNGTGNWPEAVIARMDGDNNHSATYQCQMGGGIYAWMRSYDGSVRGISFAVEPQSDARLKTVHGRLDTKLPLSNIESMNFVEFTFNYDKKEAIRRGVIAQELQKIDPEYVHKKVYKIGGGEEMEILQLDLTPMTLDALAAIQELSNQVKELKAELKQIKGD